MNSNPKAKHHYIKMPKEKLESKERIYLTRINNYTHIASTNLNLVEIA